MRPMLALEHPLEGVVTPAEMVEQGDADMPEDHDGQHPGQRRMKAA